MTRRYLTDDEYRDHFFQLGNVRNAVARDLVDFSGGKAGRILDIASGHGLFGLEVSRAFPKAQVCATGLEMDKRTFVETRWALRSRGLRTLPHLSEKLLKNLCYVVTDVTKLPFTDESFDATVNLLGLEDVRMTKGEEGMRKAIKEAARVTKPGGVVEFAIQAFSGSPEDILAREIMEDIGHGAIFLGPAIYEAVMDDANLRVKTKKRYSTERVLTAPQAREELQYTCMDTSKVYGRYGVRTKTFEEIWEKFGERIEMHGYALYTDILAFFAVKKPPPE